MCPKQKLRNDYGECGGVVRVFTQTKNHSLNSFTVTLYCSSSGKILQYDMICYIYGIICDIIFIVKYNPSLYLFFYPLVLASLLASHSSSVQPSSYTHKLFTFLFQHSVLKKIIIFVLDPLETDYFPTSSLYFPCNASSQANSYPLEKYCVWL